MSKAGAIIKLIRNIKNTNETYNDMLVQFPKNELKTFERYCTLTHSDNYIVYDATDNGKKIGYVIVIENKELKYIWIDYLAVFKTYHGQGFGHKILKELNNLYKDYNGCFLEVEKENEKDINTKRRIKFYKSQGATELPADYFYPDYNEALPMNLYYFAYKKKYPENIKYEIKFVFNLLHSDVKNLCDVFSKITIEK